MATMPTSTDVISRIPMEQNMTEKVMYEPCMVMHHKHEPQIYEWK